MQPSAAEPRLRVEPLAVSRRADLGRDHWQVTWRIRNVGARPVCLLETWLPHGKFRGARQPVVPPRLLPPSEELTLELTVAWAEGPGSDTENAFLILRVECAGQPWRVFTRLRVLGDPDGTPAPRPELTTVQPVSPPSESGGDG